MTSKKKNLAFAAISALPLSHAAAAIPSPATGAPTRPGEQIDLQIIDNGVQSKVLLNGTAIDPDFYGPVSNPTFPRTSDGSLEYELSQPAVAGDIYFVNPDTQRLAGMVRIYGSTTPTALFASGIVFSVFSFASLNGAPDGSPFDATIYPAGVSASSGLAGMPTVDVGQTFAAPGVGGDSADTGTFQFILAPEPATASLVGIGAAILFKRRPARK